MFIINNPKKYFVQIEQFLFILSDPIKNTKVDATSTGNPIFLYQLNTMWFSVFGVIQIGLRGGIFQYTNAMKALGKPSPVLEFEDA